MRRWFSWVESMGEFQRRWHTVLLALTFLGIKGGLYCTHDVPMVAWLRGGLGELDKNVGEAPGDKGDDQSAMRKKFQNTLLLSSRLLADSMRHRRSVLLVAALKPLFTAHSKELKNIRDEDGRLQYTLAWAQGSYKLIYQKISKVLSDMRLLRRLGFHLADVVLPAKQGNARGGASSSNSSGAAGSSSSEARHKRDFELDLSYEGGLCEDAVRLCVELVRQRALSMSHWRNCLPYIFIGLLSKSDSCRKDTLRRLEQVWVVLERAEVTRHKSVVVAQLLEFVFVFLAHPLIVERAQV